MELEDFVTELRDAGYSFIWDETSSRVIVGFNDDFVILTYPEIANNSSEDLFYLLPLQRTG